MDARLAWPWQTKTVWFEIIELQAAKQAIKQIIEQGEGTQSYLGERRTKFHTR